MPDRLDPVGTPRQISDRLDPVGTPRPKLPSPFGEGLGVRPGRGWGGVNFRVKLYIISKNNSVKSVVCERSFMMTRPRVGRLSEHLREDRSFALEDGHVDLDLA